MQIETDTNIFKDTVFLIPARKNSKGFPFKNRKLFLSTASSIPQELKGNVYVSTDDSYIKKLSNEAGFNTIDRPPELAEDTSSLKEVLLHFRSNVKISKNCDIILLFLTYPERTWQDIENIFSIYKKSNKKSLICCEKVKEHPYLCFLHDKTNNTAELLIKHDKYRRQDYPPVVRQSMFFSCYNESILNQLHDLLFEKDTFFYVLDETKVDIDYEKDYNSIQQTKRGKNGK